MSNVLKTKATSSVQFFIVFFTLLTFFAPYKLNYIPKLLT